MRTNIITAIAGDKPYIKTDSVFQYDYGLKLVISGVTLPESYDVHFSNTNKPSAKTVTGDSSGVLIPDEYLLNGEDVHAWVYLHTEGLDDDGETVYHIQIPVVARAAIAEEQITPVQHNVIEEALEEMAEAVAETQANVTHYPYINEENYWMVYDAEHEQFVNTGVKADGSEVSGKADLDVISTDYASLIFPVISGQGCIHEGVRYKAIQDIPTSEEWNVAHWEVESIEDSLGSVKSDLNVLEPSASASDVGKFLKAKTVSNGKVTEYEFGEGGGGSVDPQDIADAVDAWCDENITNPSNPPLDRSCLSSSSAAPADILGAVKEMGTTKKTGLISPFVQGSISGGTVDPTVTTSCYIGPFDVKKDDTVTYSRYNSDIAYSNSIILFTTDGTYSSAVALMPGDTYTFLSDGKFAAQCTVNTGRTLENAITAANNSFTVSLSEEPKIVTEVKKTDGKIATAVTASENAIYPHMIGIKNYSEITDVAKAVIRSVVLYDADPTATYCLAVMDATLNSTAKFEIYKLTSQMAYDTKVCEYNSSSFDGSKIIRLEQANRSGIHAEICLDWSVESSITIYGVKYVIDPSAYRIDRVVQEQNILLPSNLYVLNNRPQQIFPKSLLINRAKDGNNFATEWSGYSESDKLGEDVVNIRYSANGADMDVSLRLQDQLTGEGTYFASKKFHVNPIATATNESLKVLCIGDSFMDYPWYTTDQMGHSGKGIMAFIKEYASADSNTIDFIGTHLSYSNNGDDYYSESYGGWSEDSYVDNAKHSYEGSQIYSPFCINGTANSYSAYFTTLGETPDIVVFFLGMNGDYSSTTGQAIQTMITGIKAVNANTKFIVCTIPGYFKNRYLYNYSYSSGDNQKYMKNNAYYTLFDNAESSGVYICPINAMWDSEYHYITADEAILRFNTDVKVPICRNHHPNQTGVQMIADAIYTVIQAILNAE